MKIIIIGAGKVGFTVAEHLSKENHDITIIEKNSRTLEKVLEAIDVKNVCGSGTDCEALREAQADRADLVLALTGSDEQNLLGCLLAKKLGAKNTIARIRNPEYYRELSLISDDLGLSLSVNPERETASEIARILEFPLAKKVENFSYGKVEMINCDVSPDSPMVNRPIRDIFAQARSALICAVERNEEVFIPLGDFVIEEGDNITVIAPARQLSGFFEQSGIKLPQIKNVIITGGGRTSYYLCEILTKRGGVNVTLIEQDEQKALALSQALAKVNIVVGDGTSHALLEEEGLKDADAFCCLTGIDEENILASLYAKKNVNGIKTITKINRVELVPVVNSFGLGSIVSPELLAADKVVSYVRAKQNSLGSAVLMLYKIVDGKAEALEFEVGSDSHLANKPISELLLKDNVIIACINRGGTIISPRGSDMLLPSDTVIVVTTHPGFKSLDDIGR